MNPDSDTETMAETNNQYEKAMWLYYLHITKRPQTAVIKPIDARKTPRKRGGNIHIIARRKAYEIKRNENGKRFDTGTVGG